MIVFLVSFYLRKSQNPVGERFISQKLKWKVFVIALLSSHRYGSFCRADCPISYSFSFSFSFTRLPGLLYVRRNSAAYPSYNGDIRLTTASKTVRQISNVSDVRCLLQVDGETTPKGFVCMAVCP